MISGLFPRRAPTRTAETRASLENPSTPLSNPDPWLFNAFGAAETPNVSGVPVSPRSALSVLAVYACIRIISEAVASLPLLTYRRLSPRGKERADDHPVYELLHDRPNPEMSAMTFREMLQAHVLTWGNAYAEIETNKAGTVIGLWPLAPDRTWPERRGGQRVYKTTLPSGQEVVLPAERVFHMPGLSFDGMRGYSPIQLARNAIGLSAAAEQFGSSFFGRGTTMAGVLTTDKTLKTEGRKNLRESWEMLQTGLSNAHRIGILEDGVKWQQISIPPDHAQFIETRKFQLAEIARLYRVPPHLIADLERGSSYASVEQMSQDFVTYTLRPWLVRWEQVINYDLFGARERSQVFAEHLVDGLLRGDMQSRYNAYAIGRQWGWLSANDVREIENQNPLPDDQGDIYLVPSNMVPADKANDIQPPGSTPAPEPTPASPAPVEADPADDPGQRAAYVALLRDVGERMTRRHVEMLRKAHRKQGESGWTQAVEGVYREQRDAFTKALAPVFDALLHFGPPETRALVAASSSLASELVAVELTATRALLENAGYQGADALLATWEREQSEIFANRGADFITKLTNPTARRAAA